MITENVAVSLPGEQISIPYLVVNVVLLLLYVGVALVVAFKVVNPELKPLPVIVIVSFYLVAYIVYLFAFIKYSRIKIMMKKVLKLK